MTAEDAIRAARAEMGSAQAVKHKVWRAGWESRADLLWKDFTYTLRRLSRLPGLVFIVVLSIGLASPLTPPSSPSSANSF